MDLRNNNEIEESYLALLEDVEQLTTFLSGTEKKHYALIHQELKNCCSHVDNLIALETGEDNSLVALSQQKCQFTILIAMVEKLWEEEMEIQSKWFRADLREHPNPCNNVHTFGTQFENQAKHDKSMSIIRNSIEIPKVRGLNEIIGLQDVKKVLKSLVILPKTQPQLFHNRPMCNSILLYGPPGTGKTRLAHGLAAEANASFHNISAGDILSHYVGQTEKTIKVLFQYMKKTSEFTILFIDEIDSFCRKRASNEQEYTRRIKTEFMCQLTSIEDCKNMFIVCATNCPWDLDSAILRRLQKHIYVPLPNPSERLQLFQFFTNSDHFEKTFDNWTRLLEKTEGYSGSDLFNVVQSALNIPLNELEDTNIWKFCDDGFYEPVLKEQDFSKVICSELCDLPSNTVRARKVQMNDLINAVDIFHCTVSQSDVIKFDCFNGISGSSIN